MKEFDDLKAIIAEVEKDIEKVDRSNKAAGTRVRKAMQQLKRQAQVVRESVMKMREVPEQ
jgi:outer membrane murein-binding lipoprotein Lpp